MTPDLTVSPRLPLLERAAQLAPVVGYFFAVLVGGVLASAIARRLVTALVRRSGLEALAERAGVARLLYGVGVKQGLSAFLGSVVYAFGLVATLSAAGDIAGLAVISNLTTKLLNYLPRLLAAGGLLLGAFVAASFLRGFVERLAARNADVDSPKAAAQIAYAAVMVVGCMLAAEQAGIEVAFVTTILQISLGVLGLGLALTFALGFHGVFRNFAARHYYKPLLRIGDTVKVGDDEGMLVRFSPTALVLRTPEGDRIVPCSRFLHATVHVRRASESPPSP